MLCRYQNGDVYEGEFQDGVKHGHGTLQIGNAAVHDIYIGNWRHGKRHGYGVIDDNSRGEKYMGMWQDDHRHGNGLVITLSGLYYEAVFAHNKVNVSVEDLMFCLSFTCIFTEEEKSKVFFHVTLTEHESISTFQYF